MKMAIKGVPIDFKNPEKYYCLKYGWVKRIKYIEESRDEEASLLVFFSKHEVGYTTDGFFSFPKNPSPSCDLLLVSDMEKIPYMDKKRKVVQIHTSFDTQGNMYVTHLTDDSQVSIWQGDGWYKIPPIPQD
jgi:hypothetical protein